MTRTHRRVIIFLYLVSTYHFRWQLISFLRLQRRVLLKCLPSNLNNFDKNNKFRLSRDTLKTFPRYFTVIFSSKKYTWQKKDVAMFSGTQITIVVCDQTRFLPRSRRMYFPFISWRIKCCVISDLQTHGDTITFIRNQSETKLAGITISVFSSRLHYGHVRTYPAENLRKRKRAGFARWRCPHKTRGNLAKASSRLGITRANSLARSLARVM